MNGSPVRTDLPIPMVATQDIADAAARLVREETFVGHTVRYLLGPRDVTMAEATRILGSAIGNPELQYARFSEAEARRAMLGTGMSASVADAMLEMERGFNSGLMRPSRPRSPESTTPTSLEEFARSVFAPAFKAAA